MKKWMRVFFAVAVSMGLFFIAYDTCPTCSNPLAGFNEMEPAPVVFDENIPVTPAVALYPGDVGNFNDYDDYGGNDDYDYGGNDYDYGNDDYTYGGGTTGRGGGGTSSSSKVLAIFGIIIIIIINTTLIKARKRSRQRYRSTTPAPAPQLVNYTDAIRAQLMTTDPNFSPDRFISWGKEVFVQLQAAWTARDWNRVRPFENDTMFKTHQTQLEEYIRTGRINIVERVCVNTSYLTAYTADEQYEYITMYLQADMNDYIIDERTRAVVKGDPNRRFHSRYTMKFMRRKGVQTNPATSNKSTTNCPNCGAPTEITSTGKCEFCSSVITTGDFDWVLCELNSIR